MAAATSSSNCVFEGTDWTGSCVGIFDNLRAENRCASEKIAFGLVCVLLVTGGVGVVHHRIGETADRKGFFRKVFERN